MKMNNVKTIASDLAADTIDRVAEVIQQGQDAAGETTKGVGEDVARAATKVLREASPTGGSSRLATVGRAVAVAASVRALVAALGPAEPGRRLLSVLNLQRRPSAASRVARGLGFVALGASVGVGAALLLTPKTGVQLRARLRTLIQGAGADVEHAAEALSAKAQGVVDHVGASVREAAHDIEGNVASMGRVTVEGGLTEPTRFDAGGGQSQAGRGRSRSFSDGAPKT